MTPERYARAKRIFLAACDLDAEAARAHVETACEGDVELREEVESLLAFHRAEATDAAGERPDAARRETLAGRYEVVRELGRGGMGRVYEAVDTRFRRTVAVKELAVESASARAAFEREARLLNGLRHRGLPVVTDYFADRDRFFLVMDFVPGDDLKSLMESRRAPFAVETVLDWADRILEVLVYLGSFAPPIVHRDVKPQNIKLTPEGEVVLLDFGLAKGSAGPPSGRLMSLPGFTLNYAPLEQVRGAGTDPRSDLFALGATLHYLLTGRTPPSAVDRADEILASRPDPLRPISERHTSVPSAVAAVVHAALSLKREDRPASATAMRAALVAARAAEADTAIVRETTDHGEAVGQVTNPMTRLSPNSLPQQVTGFVGRDVEVAEVAALAREARLVTIGGMGGIGKTRLALRVASDLLDEHRDGVWYADLSAAAAADHVVGAVAVAVGVREEPGVDLADALVDRLRPGVELLVLDGCEHVVAACAALVDRLLRACPRLRVLAASRERLGLRSETVYPLGPMRLPEAGADPTAAESVRLFVARARMLRPSFHLDEGNAASVAAVCRRLDGIPLAIELAAGRVGVLAVEQILARLDDRFRLLASADRDAPARQQTLRGTVDWSYELLTDAERWTLQRLAVFPSPCSLEGAEAVCSAGCSVLSAESSEPSPTQHSALSTQHFESPKASALDLLTRLVDTSFVTVEEVGAETRYRMLETVREYALDKLRESGDEPAANRALVAWARELSAASYAPLMGAGQAEWLGRIEVEYENLRAALAFAVGDEPSRLAGLDLATFLCRFWLLRGRAEEARSWVERFIALCPDAPAAALGEAHRSAGAMANMSADFDGARAHYERAIEYGRKADVPARLAGTLSNFAITLRDVGDLDAAAASAEEGLAILRQLDDRTLVSLALMNLGAIEQDRGDHELAARYFEECLGIKRELGDRFGAANALTNQAGSAVRRRDYDRAEALLGESIELRRDLGEQRGMALDLMWLALVALGRGRHEECERMLGESLDLYDAIGDRRERLNVVEAFVRLRAARHEWERALELAGSAAAARERLGAPIMPMDLADLAEAIAAARAALGDDAADAALARGRVMPLEKAVGRIQ